MGPWYLESVVCPRDHLLLRASGNNLVCAKDHSYPVVEGVPVMLLDDVSQSVNTAGHSLQRAREYSGRGGAPSGDLFLETSGISEEEKEGVIRLASQPHAAVDPLVSYLIAATNGFMYKHLIGKLREYPIPDLRLPHGNGRSFLEIGCNWGRWCIAAARRGYNPIGMDPSLGAVMAARRVANRLDLGIRYLVADGRHLPFREGAFDSVFSYSVLQHLGREEAARVASEIGRVLKSGGNSLVQMPNRTGFRCLYHQARRGFREGAGFEVRYWSLPSLRRLCSSRIGPTEIFPDGFFGIGVQSSDLRFMTLTGKLVIHLSEALRKASGFVKPLSWVADSVYVSSMKPA